MVKVYYSPQVAPHVLKREIVYTGRRRKKRYSVVSRVVKLGAETEVLDQTIPTTQVQTTQQNGSARMVTTAYHANTVPGEVVAYEAKELNPNGQIVRRSRMEVVDYGLKQNEGRRRARKTARKGK